MPRGRPRKVVEPEQPKEITVWREQIAQIIQEYCSIPGCTYKFHLEEASRIVQVFKEVVNS